MTPTASRIATASTAFTAALTLAGCGHSDEATATPSASAPAAGLTPKQQASIEAGAGIPPKPDAKTQAAYIAALDAIDPAIVSGKADRAVSRGRDECSSIHSFPNDRAKLVDLTNQRFTTPDHPDGFGAAKAGKILNAVHKYLCPDFPMG